MENKGIKYEFTAKVWNYSSTAGTGGWYIACLPKEMSKEIRENLKFLEEGWGRLKMTAKIGNTQWETAIWFDTKLNTYLLPLKAEIRKKEKIGTEKEVEIMIGFKAITREYSFPTSFTLHNNIQNNRRHPHIYLPKQQSEDLFT